ncbi:DNA topoisomerase IV subunit B [compost metagenome]
MRNKKETIYCYSDDERKKAIEKLGNKPEITRFKGLGEISPDEFGLFIGKDIRLDPVILKDQTIKNLLEYYMGKNTPDRQQHIIRNLRIEKDEVTPEDLKAEEAPGSVDANGDNDVNEQAEDNLDVA